LLPIGDGGYLKIMSRDQDANQMFGRTGFQASPIVLGTSALGNACRVITDQAKAEIIAEWFRQPRLPMFVEVAYDYGQGLAIEVLGRALRRLEISSDEIVIQLTAGGVLSDDWEKCCRLLGDEYRPKLISGHRDDVDNLHVAQELKAAGRVRGVGVVVFCSEIREEAANNLEQLAAEIEKSDWCTLHGGCTVMRHPSEMLALLAELAQRQVPVVVAGAFDGGFLVGGNKLDGRLLHVEDEGDRSLFAWRKSFVALCDGHGISPAHACLQFALSLPTVAAVRVESTYVDRIAENIRATVTKAPDNFWMSMKEEGLLEADYPFLG